MAEGWLRHLDGSRFDVASAGTHPVGLNPKAVAVMREVGIDISRHRSKRLDELSERRFDFAITVCDRAKETCPIFPGATSVLHWSFDDPAEAQGDEEARLAVFRRVRDEIAERVREFMQKV
jgi:arsenate reductase